MTEIVLPEDTNPRGSIFGGRVLSLIDKCAAIVAMRHARSEVTTASLDRVDFRSGIRAGDVMVLTGRLNAAFRTSMEIEVEVYAEDPFTGRRRLATRALVTMVALGPDLKPRPVPGVELLTDDERRRDAAAHERRRQRLAQPG
jgi:acyl-CoA hydrolase